jgi:hypothetical protein
MFVVFAQRKSEPFVSSALDENASRASVNWYVRCFWCLAAGQHRDVQTRESVRSRGVRMRGATLTNEETSPLEQSGLPRTARDDERPSHLAGDVSARIVECEPQPSPDYRMTLWRACRTRLSS